MIDPDRIAYLPDGTTTEIHYVTGDNTGMIFGVMVNGTLQFWYGEFKDDNLILTVQTEGKP